MARIIIIEYIDIVIAFRYVGDCSGECPLGSSVG
jgi:hypothetical protein